MDPFDPVRNEEGGNSKRRTSILKVPRKSIVSTETVQQNKVVECPKPSDKRISRRVSFAPANDVLLFAKDVKNTSPTRSPLQELMSGGATQNGVQMKVTEDQQLTGMDTLLNTTKQIFQQKAGVSGSNFGETTMMFNANDLDLTQCHTIKITKEEDLLNTSHGFLHGHAEKTMIFDRSMDMTFSQTLNMTCDQDVSISSKPTPLSVFPFTSAMTHGMEFFSYANTDKENLVPKLNKSVTKKMDLGRTQDDFDLNVAEANPLHCLFPQEIFAEPDRRKSQSSSQDNNFTYEPVENASKQTVKFAKDDDKIDKTIVFSDGGFMDITQNWTSNIMVVPSASTTVDTCLKGKKNITTGLSARLSGDQGWTQHQDIKLQRGPNGKGLETSLKIPMQQIMTDFEEESKEKTVRFSADDACMDVTSCHTVKISAELQQQPDLVNLPVSGEKTIRFTTNEAGMDITQCLTVNIAKDLVPAIPVLQKQESSVGCLPAQSVDLDFENFFASISGQKPKVNTPRVNINKPFMKTQNKTQTMLLMNDSKITRASNEGAENCLDESNVNMDITEAHTRLITNVGQAGITSQQQRSVIGTYPNKDVESSRKSQIQMCPVNFDAEDLHSDRTMRFAADNALMDVTRSHTVHISSDLKSDLPFSEKTVRFDAAMETTQCHTVNITNDLDPPLHDGLGRIPKYGENTVKFKADDALMDVTNSHTVHISTDLKPDLRFDAAMDTTKCHTVNIINDLDPPLHDGLGRIPKYGENTVKFKADDALMDVTSSHTVHISTDLKPDLPFSEKTVQFDAAMDETQCHTVNITNDFNPKDACLLPKSGKKNAGFGTNNITKNEKITYMGMKENNLQKCANDSKLQLHGNSSPLSGEKTLRISIDDENMDVTKSHTMMIDIEPQEIPDLADLPRNEDKTVQFSSDDGGMEVTQCLTSNIGFEVETTGTDLSPTPSSITMDCPALKKREPAIYTNRRCKSLAGHGLNSALKTRRSVPWGNQAVTSTFASVNGNISAAQSQVDSKGNLKYVTDSFETPKTGIVNKNVGFLSVIEEKSIAEISQKEECQESKELQMKEALPIQKHSQTISEDHQASVATVSTPSEEEGNNEESISKCDVELKVQLNSPQINNKSDDEREVEEKTGCLRASLEKDSDAAHSQKNRRRSLANIQSKMRRISQMLSAPPDNVEVDSNTLIPSSDPEPKVELNEIKSMPEDEPDANAEARKGEDRLGDDKEEAVCAPATPFRLETHQLMSRLSVGGIKPKLPRRSKSDEAKTPNSSLAQAACDSTKTQNIQLQNQVVNFDLNVSDINDEELGSYEDVSENLDTNCMDKGPEIITSFHEFELDQELQDEVFEEEFALVSERKRPLPDEENITENEKRMKTCNESIILDSQTCTLEGDNIAAASSQTADSSNCSQTASLRCEATFESTSKQSLFESQLEDYANDIQRKFDDGSLTMAEFFKLFHIDFVIHNPRQSVVPGRTLSDPESTLLDLSHDRHISLPKQLVYEANVRSLTEQVEGFKVRMRDLDKPLSLVNKTLWEEMEHFSETEFKSFGGKLKERHSLYRKMSKAQSHEMKGLLYSNLIQANEEEQKKLRGSIEKADAMLKNLDDCIAELEADLATAENDVKSHQEELNKVTDALATNEKAVSEVEIDKKQNVNKVKRLKDETKNLEKHLDMLHTLNEWKLVEITTNSMIYTFLHKTLHLVLVFEESKENEDERMIADISFKHLLDERSQCHAHLVHTLVSQFTQEISLTRKYSTSKHVPQLLHDVSLVVSRCRQLGEELRRLKTWGSLRFDILKIHCLHSEVYIVFSSLKRFAKFEIVFNVSLTNQLCALELKSFKNIIGNTTIQQIEEIVSLHTPGQNDLTKIIKDIHSHFC